MGAYEVRLGFEVEVKVSGGSIEEEYGGGWWMGSCEVVEGLYGKEEDVVVD